MKWRQMKCTSKVLVFLTGLTLVGQGIFAFMPNLAEGLYGNGVYPIIRSFLDLLHWPISGIYLLLLVVFVFIVFTVARLFRKKLSIGRSLMSFSTSMLKLLAVLLIWFYLIWGFNYNRPDIMERMEIDVSEPDTTWIFSELRQVIDEANKLRALPTLAFLNDLNEQDILSTDLAIDEINADLERVLPHFKYDIIINPPFRFIQPSGVLLHWSTAGIYWPFSGESNVDRGVHYIKKPVTVAHELAHAHGLTSEGDCNFVAYLACVQSENPILQYSGQLSYLGYLMRDALRILGRDGLTQYYNLMSEEIRSDREKIYEHHNQYEDYFPKLRNKVYDSYLKSQGVKGGIASYNYFVKLKYNLVE